MKQHFFSWESSARCAAFWVLLSLARGCLRAAELPVLLARVLCRGIASEGRGGLFKKLIWTFPQCGFRHCSDNMKCLLSFFLLKCVHGQVLGVAINLDCKYGGEWSWDVSRLDICHQLLLWLIWDLSHIVQATVFLGVVLLCSRSLGRCCKVWDCWVTWSMSLTSREIEVSCLV